MRRREFVSAALPLAGLGASAQPVDRSEWQALRDVALVSDRSNALDFSALGDEGAAGRHGWARPLPNGIGFERHGAPRRFLCASMVFSPPNGGLPPKDDARRLAAELRRTGYNAARLHFIDAHLMEGRTKDFDFDADRLDRLHFLLAQLKGAGIYWIVDGLTSDNGAYGDVGPNRYVLRHAAKADAITSDAGFDHWRRVVDGIWGVRNPYTGSVPLADPALLGMILVNEGGLAFGATVRGGRYMDSLAVPFAVWARSRYADDDALRRAWGSLAGADESLSAGRLSPPATVRGQTARDKDFARFIAQIEADALQRMDAHVRQRGFGGLTTAFDSWGFFGADVTRSSAAWVDMHAYHTEPTRHGERGSKIAQTSLLDTMGRAVRELSNARHWGKPFTVSEYAQPFWNRYRYEMSALVPAMAAHHGWSMVCQFAEVPLQMDYGRSSNAARRRAIYPYGVGADPIARAGERLAALLYLRGDVAASSHRIRVHLDRGKVFDRSGGWEQLPEALSRLAFVAPIGLDFGPVPAAPVAGEISVNLADAPPDWLSKLQSTLLRGGVSVGRDELGELRRAGILGATNRSDSADQRYESDTGQLLIEGRVRRFTINTPRTAVVITAGDAGRAGALSVEQVSGAALLAASALDERPLRESRRVLVWVLTDAMNGGMTFEGADRSTLDAIGSFPPLVRVLQFRLLLEGASLKTAKAWVLSLNGDRREGVPLDATDTGVRLAVDTGNLTGGPGLYFEVAAE